MTMPREERIALADKVRYKHFRIPLSTKKHAYATVAFALNEAKDWCWYALTFCAPDDSFTYKEGRSKARGRLFAALKKGLGGHSGSLNLAELPKFDPGKNFATCLRNWLRDARYMGTHTKRWYYDFADVVTLKVEPIEKKR